MSNDDFKERIKSIRFGVMFHPLVEDYKLPLIIASNLSRVPRIPQGSWSVVGLRDLVRQMLEITRTPSPTGSRR